MSSISLRNVDLEFGGPNGVLRVLDNVSFDIEDHSFTCLLGPSGAGKTVTLNLLAGLLKPTRGEVLIDGQAAEDRAVRYGYVFQQPRLLPWRTVSDNIRFALRAAGQLDSSQQDKKIESVLDLVGLSGYANFYPHQLSGGMQQRVGIARAYALEPGVLFMDEPFSNLDEMTSRSLRQELVQTWMQARRTVVFVTHDISEASYLADRIVIYTVKPSRVAADLPIATARPREYGSEELYRAEQDVLREFERSKANLNVAPGPRPDGAQ